MADSDTTPAPEGMLAHSEWVRRLARALVAAPDADDVEQQTWLATLQKPPRDSVLNLRAWLGGVVRRVARDRERQEHRRERRERRVPLEDLLPSAQEVVEKAELHRRVVEAVLELREPFRSTLLLHYFEERSSEEIARHLGVPGSTVRNRVHRGVEMLRRRFLVEADDPKKNLAGLMALAFPGTASTAALVSSGVTGGMAMGAKLVAALMIVGALGVGAWMVIDPGDGKAEATAFRGLGGVAGVASEDSQEVAPVAPDRTADPGFRVAGTVVDEAGQPVAAAQVFVGGRPSPFEDPAGELIRVEDPDRPVGERDWLELGATAEQLEERGLAAGHTFETDARGRFDVALPGPRRVYVAVAENFGLRPVGPGQWHDAPADRIDLVVTRLPFARVRMSVLDETRGETLPSSGAIYRYDRTDRTPRVHRWNAGSADTLQAVVELPSRGATRFRFRVWEPFVARGDTEVTLNPGEDREVVIRIEGGEGLRGRVVGPADQPLPGAVVFWGPQRRIRGEWDWSPYQPDRLLDAAPTDEQGQFHLPGQSDVVTVWHPEWSPTTVAAANADVIRLGPRGHISGRLVDGAGQPLPGQKVLRNDRDEVTTDADGRFRYDSVEAGIHGLKREGEDYQHHTGVVIRPGETLEVEMIHSTTARTIPVRSGGRPLTGRLEGMLVGLDDIYTLQRYRASDGTAQVTGTRSGRYVLLSSQGTSRVLDLADPDAFVDMGVCSLTVTAEPGAVLCLRPIWLDDVHKFARDQARFRRVRIGDSGTHTWQPIPAGEYRIHDAGVDFYVSPPVLAEFEVKEPGTEVRLEKPYSP